MVMTMITTVMIVHNAHNTVASACTVRDRAATVRGIFVMVGQCTTEFLLNQGPAKLKNCTYEAA